MAAKLVLIRYIEDAIDYYLMLDKITIPNSALATSGINLVGSNEEWYLYLKDNAVNEIRKTTTVFLCRSYRNIYKYTTKRLFYKWLRTTGLYNINSEPIFYAHLNHYQEEIFQSIPLTKTELETIGTLFLERLLDKIRYYYTSEEINERMEKYEILFKANGMYKK